MGVAELRDAFNEAAGGTYSCQRATMHMIREHDVESQVLTFYGTGPDGAEFEVSSGPVPPNTDVVIAARETALGLIDRNKVKEEPTNEQPA